MQQGVQDLLPGPKEWLMHQLLMKTIGTLVHETTSAALLAPEPFLLLASGCHSIVDERGAAEA